MIALLADGETIALPKVLLKWGDRLVWSGLGAMAVIRWWDCGDHLIEALPGSSL
jgi:hypothetical protein